MKALEHAVGLLARVLEEQRVPYMLIGGIANLVWGEPRATLDVDASILVEETEWPHLSDTLSQTFRMVPQQPLAFLRDPHVLPIATEEGIRIDLIWARLPYEQKAIARARMEEVAGQRVRVCRPEDLVIYKNGTDRSKDREDVRAIIHQQGSRLDRRYITQAVRALARALDQPDLLTFLNSCFQKKSHDRKRLR